jgi:ubiquinone/menaquinone biosynthesis C-methylase UbiE
MAPENISALYKNHPLRRETILARIQRERKSLDSISELNLAFDPQGAITDQNHVGGIGFTVALARATSIGPSMHVLDLGCGLGGSIRLLSYLYGCKATGYDVSSDRIAEAKDLTQLVNLGDFVDFKYADLMTSDVPANQFDVIWGQSSWTHILHKDAFLEKWSGSLKPGGMVALEDLYLRRNPQDGTEVSQLSRFEADSMSKVVVLQQWKQILCDCSFSITVEEHLSNELIDEERRLTRTDNARSSDETSNETEKTNLLLDLAEKGILGYFRLVAKRATDSRKDA